ncbi:MAG: hypothetical protein HYY17_11065 [Planctomycetes bacterium]|nr:hypothetical protein [Planctomycetota bacterium]
MGVIAAVRVTESEMFIKFAGGSKITMALRDLGGTGVAQFGENEPCANQGVTPNKGAKFLLEVFSTVVPETDPAELFFANRDPFVDVDPDPNLTPLKAWGIAFAYVVSSRVMNGTFSQVITTFEEKLLDKDDKIRGQWEPEPHHALGTEKPTSLPRFDINLVYPAQWRLRENQQSKFTAMVMFDLPLMYERTSRPQKKGQEFLATVGGIRVHEGDKEIRKLEFATYARVDTDDDGSSDRFVYRMDIGAEYLQVIGEKASKGTISITKKLAVKNDATTELPSRCRVTKFPAGADDDFSGLKPFEDAAKNDNIKIGEPSTWSGWNGKDVRRVPNKK